MIIIIIIYLEPHPDDVDVYDVLMDRLTDVAVCVTCGVKFYESEHVLPTKWKDSTAP